MNLFFYYAKMKTICREFIPGSEWVYFKLYTGDNISDQLLINYIHPFIRDLKKRKIITKSFFIRFRDDDYHIRLRIRLEDVTKWGNLWSLFHKIFSPLFAEGLISDIQCCVYKRELERYGDTTIEYVEKLFDLDTQITLAAIEKSFNQEDHYIFRFHFAFYMIDFIFSCFEKQLLDRKTFSYQVCEGYLKEFEFTSNAYTSQLNEKFRVYRKDIETVMVNPPQVFVDILKKHKDEIESLAKTIILTIKGQKNLELLKSILSGIIHMFINRLFPSNNRLYEMIIFYFLTKLYNSFLVRGMKLINDK